MENKIAKLFEEKKRVSLMNDIIPIVLDKYKISECTTELNNTMQEYIRQELLAAYFAGYPVVAVPVFQHDHHGNVNIVDYIYELINYSGEAEYVF